MGINKKQSGFTIVELLIVVVVIAILAAITIVAYTGIQNRARASVVQQSVTQANKKVLAYAVTNSDFYPPDLNTAGIVDGDTTYQYSVNNSTSPKTFCITATNTTFSYYISSAMSSPANGGCPGHGVGGVAAITNLSNNPSFEASTAGQNAYNSTLATSSLWSQNGASSLRITPNSSSSTDSFAAPGGDLGGLRLGMEAGHTYTASGTIRLAAAQTGSIASTARKLTAWYTVGGVNTQVASAAAPNAAGATFLSVTFTVPVGATAAWIRLYDGAGQGGGDAWWDSIMLTDGSTQQNYADGSSAGWVWNGTAQVSTSTGPPL